MTRCGVSLARLEPINESFEHADCSIWLRLQCRHVCCEHHYSMSIVILDPAHVAHCSKAPAINRFRRIVIMQPCGSSHVIPYSRHPRIHSPPTRHSRLGDVRLTPRTTSAPVSTHCPSRDHTGAPWMGSPARRGRRPCSYRLCVLFSLRSIWFLSALVHSFPLPQPSSSVSSVPFVGILHCGASTTPLRNGSELRSTEERKQSLLREGVSPRRKPSLTLAGETVNGDARRRRVQT